MKIYKLLIIFLSFSILAWGIEVVVILHSNASNYDRTKTKYEIERKKIFAAFKSKERQLIEKHEQQKYLATGKTVYDRIFNTQGQPIIELIRNIAKEALPKTWDCEVQAEEFTHFILLIFLPSDKDSIEADIIASHIAPVLKYCGSWLSDVAVFNSSHKSYLFLDKKVLDHLASGRNLTKELIEKAQRQGQSFTSFNSITIQCKMYQNHFFVPLEIIGPSGLMACYAMLDTGASITILSHDVIAKTGNDNLLDAPKKRFNTANGLVSLPVVYREVSVEGLRKKIEVAVNQSDNTNLLGMNFLTGLKYSLDSEASKIYIWQK